MVLAQVEPIFFVTFVIELCPRVTAVARTLPEEQRRDKHVIGNE